MPAHNDYNGLRLLSLDGGGVRGMSTLLILRQIMYLIQQRERLPTMPLPCEYFDLMGGTGTGGIIAIMLGRLRMSIDDTIDYYEIFSKTVFKGRRGIGAAMFNHKVLKRVVMDAVKLHIGNENARMFDDRENACKTFVCVRTAFNLNSGHPDLFRTYTSPVESTYDCEIWEAARATTAAPGVFERIFIGGHGFPKQPYIDGGFGLNNPIRLVLEESHFIFPSRMVACIVSIGTGQKSTIQIPNPNFRERIVGKYIPIDATKAAMEIAADCKETEKLIAKQFEKTSDLYYRFNVDQGMQLIDIADFDKVQNVTAHTNSYIRDIHRKLLTAVSALCDRRAIISTSEINGKVTLSEEDMLLYLPYNVPDFRRAQHFVARNGLQDQLVELFNKQRNLGHTAVVSLIGMGGAGKTQLALEYCQRRRRIDGLERIFWLDATSPQTIQSDMKNISQILIPSIKVEDASSALKLVKCFLSSSSNPWLMIFDNLDNPSKFDDIPFFIPASSSGAVLVTSRHHDLKRLSQYHLVLQEMDRLESFQLLLGHQPSEAELTPAKTLLEYLGWLPLAIDQAQAYMSKRHLPLDILIAEFDHRKKHWEHA